MSLGDSAFIALVIFKEAQAFAARSVRKLASRARAFLDLPPEQPPKPTKASPPMKTTIYAFLKFFKEEQHAHAFVAGRLYLNPLAYFKGLEQSADDGRADRHEAPSGWHQPASLGLIEFAGVRISPADLAGPLIIQGADADVLNILCLYAVSSGPFEKISAGNIDAFRDYLRVPARCRSMGAFVVLLRQPQVFIERFVAAVKRDGFDLQCGPVTYFDPDAFSGSVERPPFMKQQEFSWQREYRFALDRNASVPEPCTFDIGPLTDLCTIVDAARLDEPIAVLLPE